jgi:hypothetical protein
VFTLIRSKDRHYVVEDDQKTWETFDTKNNADPIRGCFGVLKILNEEILSPGGGFILHTKKDMVVVTYVREGVIIYKAHLEQPVVFGAKEFGQTHADKDTTQYAFNTSETEVAHVFQCGFDLEDGADSCGNQAPKPKGIKRLYTHAERQGVLRLIASSDGRGDSLAIQQDVQIYSTVTRDGNQIIHELQPGRSAWLHVVKGKVLHNDLQLETGDGVGLTGERSMSFTSKGPTEILVFDLCGAKTQISDPPKSKLLAVGTSR